MCNPVAIMWAGSAISAIGSMRQGAAAKEAALDDAAQADYQAKVERDNAQAEAKMIRSDGERSRGSTVASVAMSGAKIGEWSAGDVERQVLQDTETDAMTAILNGERRARGLNDSGDRSRRAGRNAQTASYWQAGSSLMSAAGKSYGSGGSAPTINPGR